MSTAADAPLLRPKRAKRLPLKIRDGASEAELESLSKASKRNEVCRKRRKGKPPLAGKEIVSVAGDATADVFIVDRILEVREDDALVSWKGWDSSENQYVKFTDMSKQVSVPKK